MASWNRKDIYTTNVELYITKSIIRWGLVYSTYYILDNILGLYRLDELTSIINDYEPEDTDIRSPSP